jgi:hypothetical protein
MEQTDLSVGENVGTCDGTSVGRVVGKGVGNVEGTAVGLGCAWKIGEKVSNMLTAT